MKKILLLALIIAAASQLKAQQLIIKPADTSLLKAPKTLDLQQFKLDDNNLLKGFSPLLKSNQLTLVQGLNNSPLNTEAFYSRMPVVQVTSDDRMPVAKLDGASKMPVKNIEIADPLAKSSTLIVP